MLSDTASTRASELIETSARESFGGRCDTTWRVVVSTTWTPSSVATTRMWPFGLIAISVASRSSGSPIRWCVVASQRLISLSFTRPASSRPSSPNAAPMTLALDERFAEPPVAGGVPQPQRRARGDGQRPAVGGGERVGSPPHAPVRGLPFVVDAWGALPAGGAAPPVDGAEHPFSAVGITRMAQRRTGDVRTLLLVFRSPAGRVRRESVASRQPEGDPVRGGVLDHDRGIGAGVLAIGLRRPLVPPGGRGGSFSCADLVPRSPGYWRPSPPAC